MDERADFVVRALAVVIGTVVFTPAVTLLLTVLLMWVGLFEQTEEGMVLYLCTFPLTFVVLLFIAVWTRDGAA